MNRFYKISIRLVSMVLLLALLSFLSPVIQAVDPTPYTPIVVNPPGIAASGPTSLAALIDNVLRFAMYAIGVLGVVMISYSAFLYVISVGKPDKIKQALNSIIYTAIGFGIAILARSLVEFFAGSGVLNVCTVGTNTSNICKDVPTLITDGLATFMWVIGVSAVIVIIVSGLLYVTSAGDPGKTKTAKDAIMYAAIGLGIAVIGGSIIQFVATFLS